MKQFMHFEDNGDDTISVTLNDGEQEHAFLIPMSFDDMMMTIVGDPERMAQAEKTVEEVGFVIIPNEVA